MFKDILTWAIQSTQFKKWSGIIGGAAFGMWASMNYHVQIRATLAAWGVDRSEWGNTLVFIMAASGIAASVGLSVAKSRQAAKDNAAADAAEGNANPQPPPTREKP